MTRYWLGCFLALAVAAPAAAAPSISVGEAAETCKAGFPPPAGASASLARRSACIALIDGVIGTVQQLAALAAQPGGGPARAVFCVPPSASYEALASAFIKTAEANPPYRDRAAATMVVAGLATAYPCP